MIPKQNEPFSSVVMSALLWAIIIALLVTGITFVSNYYIFNTYKLTGLEVFSNSLKSGWLNFIYSFLLYMISWKME